MSWGPLQILLVLLIVLLLFGTKKLRGLGSDLGNAIKGFKKAVNSDETEEPPQATKNKSVDKESSDK